MSTENSSFANLFKLTPEQEELSKLIYNGKIIRCLVAPYHSYRELVALIPDEWNTYIFPERDLSYNETRRFIADLVSPMNEVPEFNIVTSSISIVLDMISDCVRVFDEDGKVISITEKTFHANIHAVRAKLFENKDHQNLTDDTKINSYSHTTILTLLDRINSKEPATRAEYDSILAKCKQIGEVFIRSKLIEQLNEYVKIV